MEQLENLKNELAFRFRSKFLGKIPLRHSAPEFKPDPQEIKVYDSVLDAAGLPRHFERVIDVGCRNWSYLPSLISHFDSSFIGVEVDVFRRNLNMHRRLDYLKAAVSYAKKMGVEAGFAAQDFRKLRFRETKSTLVLFFFPFVSSNPCLKWGLPTSFSDFSELVEAAKKIPGITHIASVHLGNWELSLAEKAYRECGLTTVEKKGSPYPILISETF
ncbi:MAG: hypothetical protein AB7F43_13835 [Bacteriovoracia bacterium]